MGAASLTGTALLGLGLIACTAVSDVAPARTEASARPVASPSNPPLRRGARVEIAARGRAGTSLRVAVDDLRRIGFWRRLTRHLYVVKLSARPGRANVPPDAHLADAVRNAFVDRNGQGLMCDIVIYPAAVTADLDRWRSYHLQGLLPEPPPLRHFWTAIVGHEVAHCLEYRAPEEVAVRWEERILEALRREAQAPIS